MKREENKDNKDFKIFVSVGGLTKTEVNYFNSILVVIFEEYLENFSFFSLDKSSLIKERMSLDKTIKEFEEWNKK